MQKEKIKLTENQKHLVHKLNHHLYTVEYLEEWINRYDHPDINAYAALAAMAAKGFYDAILVLEKADISSFCPRCASYYYDMNLGGFHN